MRGFVMTNGDKIKLRAELAGKAMAALICDSSRAESVLDAIEEHGISQAAWDAEIINDLIQIKG